MDKLTAMRTFVAVVTAGSFSGAAIGLGVPKTRVSQRVQELEAALSVRLLYRTTRALSLTEDGRSYYDKCVQILQDIDATEQALGGKAETPSGLLRVSCMSLVARSLLLPRLAEFQALYPDLSLGLSVSDRIANLNESGFDCAIRGGQLDSSTLISRHITDYSFGLYAAPDWCARRGAVAHPAELTRADLVMVTRQKDGAARPWKLAGPSGNHLCEGPARFETDDDHAALSAAVAGAGAVLCPDFAARPLVAAGQLCRILPDWHGAARPAYFIYPTRRYLSARLRAFMDWSGAILRSA